MGVDLAKYEDYTVIIVLDVTEEPFKMVYFNRFNKMDWQYVVDKIKQIAKSYGYPRLLVDATGVGDPIVEQLRDINAEGFKFTHTSKMDLIRLLEGFVVNHKIKYPAIVTELIKEMKYFSYIKSKTGNTWKMEGVKGHHDDTIMALGLAIWATQKSTPLPLFTLNPAEQSISPIHSMTAKLI